MRIALALLMMLHGVAHLPGFVLAWRLALLEGLPYKTTVLAGRADLSDASIRVVGVAVARCGCSLALVWPLGRCGSHLVDSRSRRNCGAVVGIVRTRVARSSDRAILNIGILAGLVLVSWR